jgi:hypothetical protein
MMLLLLLLPVCEIALRLKRDSGESLGAMVMLTLMAIPMAIHALADLIVKTYMARMAYHG